MRVVEPNDREPLLACPHAAPAQAPVDRCRTDSVANPSAMLVQRMVACTARRIAFEGSKQDSTTLVWVGFFPVVTEGLVIGRGEFKHDGVVRLISDLRFHKAF